MSFVQGKDESDGLNKTKYRALGGMRKHRDIKPLCAHECVIICLVEMNKLNDECKNLSVS